MIQQIRFEYSIRMWYNMTPMGDDILISVYRGSAERTIDTHPSNPRPPHPRLGTKVKSTTSVPDLRTFTLTSSYVSREHKQLSTSYMYAYILLGSN